MLLSTTCIKRNHCTLKNLKSNFSATTGLQYSQLQLDKMPETEIGFMFFINEKFSSGSQKNLQTGVLSAPLEPKQHNGDAENARHELAGHENAAPCCRGGKCET